MKRSRSKRVAARGARWVIQLPPLPKRAIASVFDGACFAAAMILAVALRHPDNTAIKLEHYKWFLVAAPIMGVAAFSWLGVYRQIVRFTGLGEAWRLVRGAIVATLALTALSFFTRSEPTGVPVPGVSRVVFISFGMTALALTSSWRLAARALLRPLRPQSLGQLAQEPAAPAPECLGCRVRMSGRAAGMHQVVAVDEPLHDKPPTDRLGRK